MADSYSTPPTSDEDVSTSDESNNDANVEINSDTTLEPMDVDFQTEEKADEIYGRWSNGAGTSSPIVTDPSENSIIRTLYSQDIQSRQTVITLDNLKKKTNFISASKYMGEKTGMMYFWGPYGLGYYSNVAKNWINIYSGKIQRFNSLTKKQRKSIHAFMKVIQDWEETDILFFFEMIGLKKHSFINIKNLMKLLVSESCPVCLDIIYPLKDRRKCISFECGGMCKQCHVEVEDICPACDKKQEIKCPICLEYRPVWAAKILSCHHGMCWPCYGGALEKGQAIINCPQCRKAI